MPRHNKITDGAPPLAPQEVNMADSVIHCIARCTVCSWEEHDYKTARAKAKEHAKRTGHRVTGEQAVSFEYAGKEATP